MQNAVCVLVFMNKNLSCVEDVGSFNNTHVPMVSKGYLLLFKFVIFKKSTLVFGSYIGFGITSNDGVSANGNKAHTFLFPVGLLVYVFFIKHKQFEIAVSLPLIALIKTIQLPTKNA